MSGEGPFGPLPLTPTAFLDRASRAFADRLALIGDDSRFTYDELGGPLRTPRRRAHGAGRRARRLSCRCSRPTHTCCSRPTSACRYAGAVLNALNTRLTGEELAVHRRPRGRPCPRSSITSCVDARRSDRAPRCPISTWWSPADPTTSTTRLIAEAVADAGRRSTTSWSLLALNYTSGTTGTPKGVMYQHRGAYLQALAMAAQAELRPRLGVPVDVADVPLQRVVLPVGGHRRRRHPRRAAPGRAGADLARDPAARASPTSTPPRRC